MENYTTVRLTEPITPDEIVDGLAKVGLTPADVLGRIITTAPLDAREIHSTADELRRHLFTLLAWTKPSGEVDAEEIFGAFSDAAKLVVRIGYHAKEREDLVDTATALTILSRQHPEA